MDKRRLIFAGIFIIFTILIGYLIYRVFFAPDTPDPIDLTDPNITAPGTFPTVGEGKIPDTTPTGPGTLPTSPDSAIIVTEPTQPTVTGPSFTQGDTIQTETMRQLTEVSSQNVSAAPGSGARFYNEQDGKFYRVDNAGGITPLNDQIFFNVENVNWSPTNDESIIEYPDGSNIYYNFDTNEQVTLPKHWEDFTFSDNGTEIAAKSIGLDPGNRWLITADPKAQNINLIEPMGENADKVIVDWSPHRSVVALSATGEALGGNRQEILLIGLNGENFKSLVVEGRGLETQWSPEGGKLLHSVYNARNDYKPELWIVDATPDTAGQNRKPLGVSTWAHKCDMSSERYVYCGVPDELDTGAGFAPQVAQYTSDSLYRIDTQTGIKTKIPLDSTHTIDTIHTSPDGSSLYFTDTVKSGVFHVPLN